ncbi:MAG: LamG-like jellyroll fold domain-containing protein [Kofleriaceae bacterium]
MSDVDARTGDPDVDASVTDDDAPASAIDAPPAAACGTTDPALQLCLEFDESSLVTARDGSGNALDAAMANVMTATRTIPTSSPAVKIAGTSTITIPDSAVLDQSAFTISAWIQRSSLPAIGERFGIVDVGNRQAALAIDDNGTVTCLVKTIDDLWAGTGGSTTLNQWALVACTYQAPQLCMYVFKNGSATPTKSCGSTDGAAIDTSANPGGAIGALFDTANVPEQQLAGNLDSVRYYSRALTQTQLCTAGGLTGC